MDKNNAARLAEIDRKFMWQGIYNLPGVFFFAGGILGKYGEPDEIPFQFLTDADTTTALIVLGVVSMLWSAFVFIALAREKMRIQSGRAD